MIIYTVVGEFDYEGIEHLSASFISESKALEYKAKCEAYDKTSPVNNYDSGYKIWKASHPMGCSFDSYDVIDHELAGSDQEIMRKSITTGAAKFFSQEPSDCRSTDLAGFIMSELIGGDV